MFPIAVMTRIDILGYSSGRDGESLTIDLAVHHTLLYPSLNMWRFFKLLIESMMEVEVSIVIAGENILPKSL
jgi:hypothetical protein